jgi:hypothetical protein
MRNVEISIESSGQGLGVLQKVPVKSWRTCRGTTQTGWPTEGGLTRRVLFKIHLYPGILNITKMRRRLGFTPLAVAIHPKRDVE